MGLRTKNRFLPDPQDWGVGEVYAERLSTPSVSPPILGEKEYIEALVFAFIFRLIRARAGCEDAGSVQISLPKIGEGSGGVDVEERLLAGQQSVSEFRDTSFCEGPHW